MPNFGQLRVKFIWGASKVIQANWRFGLFGYYEHAKGHRDSGLAISIRGVLILGLCLAVITYVAAATTLYLWLDRKPHNYVTFTDTLLFPVRQQEIREKRGQAYIDEGIDDLKAQHWSDAEMKLRIGLSRYPQAIRARLALAEFYTLTHRRPQTLKLLDEGVATATTYPGRRYLVTYFNQAYQGEEYQRILAAVDQCLNDMAGVGPKERYWLLQQKINVLLAEERTDEALAILTQQPPDAMFNEQRVLALLMMKRVPDAVKFLADWHREAGATSQILRLEVRAFRESGNLVEMENSLDALRAQAPSDPTPYAYGIIQRAMAGQDAAAKAALDDYFLRFGAMTRSMQLLAQPLAEIGAVDLLETYIRKLAEQGHDRRQALMLLAQAHLKNGEWAAAAKAMARVQTLDAAADGNSPAGLDLLTTLVAVAGNPAEGPQIQLLDYLNRQIYPLKSFRTIIATLQLAKRHEVALAVINCAERSYPGSTVLARFKSESEQALAAQRQAMADNTSPAEVTTVLNERVFFARVDEAIQQAHWTAAADMIRDVQLAKPRWLDARQADVLTRQMRVAHERREPLDMMLAAKLLLAGAVAQAQIVVDYAEELQAQKQTADAVLLLREVLRKIPNHGYARRLLEEWQKRPEPVLTRPVEASPVEPVPPAEAKPASS